MALDQESRVAFNAPATWTNRCAVSKLSPQGMIRIAFAEGAPEETKAFVFHTAVIMSVENAVGLAELILVLAKS